MLAGTRACIGCPSNRAYTGLFLENEITRMGDFEQIYNKQNKRIIEKFDKDGKLIERITEE